MRIINKLPLVVANLALWGCTLFFLWPFYWMISSSFKNVKVALQIPPEWFPLKPTWGNYRTLFVDYPLWHWVYNSLFISIVATVLVIAVSSLASYALAKISFKAAKPLFALMIGAMTIPHTVLFIPLFQLMNDLRLVNTHWGVLLPLVGWPFGVFLLKQFIQTLPSELIEASKIDGCSEWQTFYKVILPLAKPGLGVLAIFTFVSSWNDYIWQLIMLNDMQMFTLPLGVKVAQKVQELEINYGVAMAGAVLATLPVMVIFLYFQKYFTKGITLGALKG
jgi:multiple sugar transport system permease protein